MKSARISSTNVRYANFMYVTTKFLYENKDCQFMVFSIECKASTTPHRIELHCIHALFCMARAQFIEHTK